MSACADGGRLATRTDRDRFAELLPMQELRLADDEIARPDAIS